MSKKLHHLPWRKKYVIFFFVTILELKIFEAKDIMVQIVCEENGIDYKLFSWTSVHLHITSIVLAHILQLPLVATSKKVIPISQFFYIFGTYLLIWLALLANEIINWKLFKQLKLRKWLQLMTLKLVKEETKLAL